MKVRELTAKFVREVVPDLRSGNDYVKRIRALIDPPEYLGDLDVTAVDYDTLTEWTAALNQRGNRVSYNALIVLGAVFRHGQRTGKVKHNPVRGFELAKKYRPSKKDKQNALNDEQIAYFLTHIDRAVNPNVAAVLKLILHTGARPGEVLGMRRSQISDNHWTIPAEEVKTGVEDTKVLNAHALAVIGAVPDTGDLLFPIPYITLASTLQRALTAGKRPAKLRMKKFTAHDLRHTLATGLARLGVEERTISAVLNHAPQQQITARYVQFDYLPQKEQALALWAEHIEGLMAKERAA